MPNVTRWVAFRDRSRPTLEYLALVLVVVVCVVVLVDVLRAHIQPPITATAMDTAQNGRTPPPPAPPPVPTTPISMADAAVKGKRDAPLGIVEYSDYQCPYCRRFATDTLPVLEREYIQPGLLRFAFKHAPIESLHPQAGRAAEASECASRQGQFWAMHDRLFAAPKTLDAPSLRSRAIALGLDLAAFDACMGWKAQDVVTAHAREASALGVTGTPTFFIGVMLSDGRLRVATQLVGARPAAAFSAVIKQLLAEVGGDTTGAVDARKE